LSVCRNNWIRCRSVWERTEGFLVRSSFHRKYRSRIDTWPVNFNSLDSVLKKHNTFDNSLIHSFEDALKGFHPIEYILFGKNGDKKANAFSVNELNYLVALTQNFEELSMVVSHKWTSGDSSFKVMFTKPGVHNLVYPTKKQVYEEIVNALIGICDEVANGKIEEPFIQQNPALEESPFSGISITDFTNNIKSVENMYLGTFGSSNGKGLEDFVRLYNLSLDISIKQKIANAQSSP